MPDNESELTVADLRKMAKEIDSTGKAEVIEPRQKSAQKPESRDGEDQDRHTEHETEKEPTQDELAAKDKAKKLESSEISDDALTDEELSEREKIKADKEAERKSKEKVRLDKTWENVEKEKAELAKWREEKTQWERTHGRTQDITEEKDENGYSVKDYQYAIKYFDDQGDDERKAIVEKAAREQYTKVFSREWSKNLDELMVEDPELSDIKSPLAQECAKVLNTLPFLRNIPDGCKYAVLIAKGNTTKSLISELKAEKQKLKEEVEKYSRHTRLGIGGPSNLSSMENGGNSFEDLPSKDRRKFLRHQARLADAGMLPDE